MDSHQIPLWLRWLYCVFVISLIGCTSYSEPTINVDQQADATKPPPDFSGIEVTGDEDFKTDVRGALRWVWYQDQEAFYEISKYVQTIKPSERLSMNVSTKTLGVGKPARADKYWLAAFIFREAYRSKRYSDYLEAHPGDLPPLEVYVGTIEIEEACNAYAAEMMEKLQAPPRVASALREMEFNIKRK